ncbi:MAG: RNA-binding protein [Candidatus Omnitrophica bacterium]|nr:RNA-binding protein [Candidatus Omnitrophota bacterium]
MDEEKKLYVGNLEFGVTEEELRKSIEEKGITVKEVKIISDKFTGKSKGFGFAEFETEEQAQQAIEALDGKELNGRTLRVSKARKMQPRTGGGGGRREGGYGNGGGGGGYSGGRFRR